MFYVIEFLSFSSRRVAGQCHACRLAVSFGQNEGRRVALVDCIKVALDEVRNRIGTVSYHNGLFTELDGSQIYIVHPKRSSSDAHDVVECLGSFERHAEALPSVKLIFDAVIFILVDGTSKYHIPTSPRLFEANIFDRSKDFREAVGEASNLRAPMPTVVILKQRTSLPCHVSEHVHGEELVFVRSLFTVKE